MEWVWLSSGHDEEGDEYQDKQHHLLVSTSDMVGDGDSCGY